MKKDTLDIKLEQILDELCSWDSEAMTDFEYQSYKDKAKAQLKSLIKSTLLDALPKEKHKGKNHKCKCWFSGYLTGHMYAKKDLARAWLVVQKEAYEQGVAWSKPKLKTIKDSLEGI